MRFGTGAGWRASVGAAVAGVAVAALLWGCGDDGGDDGGASPTVVRPQVTVGPPGIVDGNTFISTARGYKIDFPDGWTPDENFLIDAAFGVDAFFAPEEVGGVKPNINVRCDDDPEGAVTQADFVETTRQKADRFAFGEVEESATILGGREAVKFIYEQEAGIRLKKTDVVYAGDGCAWTVTLTHAAGDDQYAALFEQALASFAFIERAGT